MINLEKYYNQESAKKYNSILQWVYYELGLVTSNTNFLSGGTFSYTGETLTICDVNGFCIDIGGFWDNYLTGGTYNPSCSGSTLTLHNKLSFIPDFTITGFTDTWLTGGTYSAVTSCGRGTLRLNDNCGGGFGITGFTDTYLTGGTFTKIGATGNLVLNNNCGTGFTITGFTDIFITGGTYSAVTSCGRGTLILSRNSGSTITITGFTNTYLTGGTYNNVTGVLTLNSNCGSGFTVSGFLTGATGGGGPVTLSPDHRIVFTSGNTINVHSNLRYDYVYNKISLNLITQIAGSQGITYSLSIGDPLQFVAPIGKLMDNPTIYLQNSLWSSQSCTAQTITSPSNVQNIVDRNNRPVISWTYQNIYSSLITFNVVVGGEDKFTAIKGLVDKARIGYWASSMDPNDGYFDPIPNGSLKIESLNRFKFEFSGPSPETDYQYEECDRSSPIVFYLKDYLEARIGEVNQYGYGASGYHIPLILEKWDFGVVQSADQTNPFTLINHYGYVKREDSASLGVDIYTYIDLANTPPQPLVDPLPQLFPESFINTGLIMTNSEYGNLRGNKSISFPKHRRVFFDENEITYYCSYDPEVRYYVFDTITIPTSTKIPIIYLPEWPLDGLEIMFFFGGITYNRGEDTPGGGNDYSTHLIGRNVLWDEVNIRVNGALDAIVGAPSPGNNISFRGVRVGDFVSFKAMYFDKSNTSRRDTWPIGEGIHWYISSHGPCCARTMENEWDSRT